MRKIQVITSDCDKKSTQISQSQNIFKCVVKPKFTTIPLMNPFLLKEGLND
ncbi:MAG TPA: hypothetical protein PLX15_04185 [Candidatus Woesearchaeota archaeon]|nr:hypothetical protein [Candidatus Woesearchaeota archaeon]